MEEQNNQSTEQPQNESSDSTRENVTPKATDSPKDKTQLPPISGHTRTSSLPKLNRLPSKIIGNDNEDKNVLPKLSNSNSKEEGKGQGFSLAIPTANNGDAIEGSYFEESNIHANIPVNVTLPSGEVITLNPKIGETVQDVKRMLQDKHEIPYATSKLFLDGKLMIDPLSLNDFPSIVNNQRADLVLESPDPKANKPSSEEKKPHDNVISDAIMSDEPQENQDKQEEIPGSIVDEKQENTFSSKPTKSESKHVKEKNDNDEIKELKDEEKKEEKKEDKKEEKKENKPSKTESKDSQPKKKRSCTII